jgi:hypothetical protein
MILEILAEKGSFIRYSELFLGELNVSNNDFKDFFLLESFLFIYFYILCSI